MTSPEDSRLNVPDDSVPPPPSTCFWITGLSGSGKTTIGRALWEILRGQGSNAVFLDGDVMRSVLGESFGGHSLEQRKTLGGIYSRLCRLLAEQGCDVVCCTISLFHDLHRMNREAIPGYFEVYLRSPMSILEMRRRELYGTGAAPAGSADVVGVDLPAEEPLGADLTIDIEVNSCPRELARLILSRAEEARH